MPIHSVNDHIAILLRTVSLCMIAEGKESKPLDNCGCRTGETLHPQSHTA